jgi:four helix bundle protein
LNKILQLPLKSFIEKFDFKKPNFENLIPYLTKEIEEDFTGFEGKDVGNYNAIKTLWQLSQPEKPISRSRVWKSPNAYIYLVPWSNASLLRVLGVKWFAWFKFSLNSPLRSYKSPVNSHNSIMGYKLLDRLEGQFLDELRSTVANIEEGFARPATSEYLQFIGYSQGSLKEAKGEFHRLRQDNLIPSIPGSNLKNLNVNLKDWHEALIDSVISHKIPPISSKEFEGKLKEAKGNYGKNSPSKSYKFNYPPIDNLDPSKLTYEIFIELINKTDYLLRKLVKSLETKLETD